MNSFLRHLSQVGRVLKQTRPFHSELTRTAQLMREANRLEVTSPAAAAALRVRARSFAPA